MANKITGVLKKLRRPLRTIEYIISIGVLWAGIVAVSLFRQDEPVEGESSFTTLIDQYEVVSLVILAMVVIAVIDLMALSVRDSRRSINIRADAMFGNALGFFFVSVLTVLSSGIDNLLWANEFNLALISAVLYINLKVNSTIERQQ